MPDPDYFQMLGIPSQSEQRVRGVLGSVPAPTVTASSPAQIAPLNPQEASAMSYYQALDNPTPAPAVDPWMVALQGGRRLSWQQAQQQAAVDHYAKQAISGLTALDPADPDHLSHQEAVLSAIPPQLTDHLLKDHRVTGALRSQTKRHAELQHYFDSDPQSQYEYATLKQAGTAPEEAFQQVKKNSLFRHAQLEYAKSGGDPEDLHKFVDPKSGVLDWPAALHHRTSDEGDVLTLPSNDWRKETEALRKQYEAAASEPLTGTDDVAAKEKWIADHKLDRAKPESWQQAHTAIVAERVAPIVEKIQEHAEKAKGYNFMPDNQFRKLGGLPPIPTRQGHDRRVRIDRAAIEAAAKAEPAPAADQRVKVETQEQYDALPKGTKFWDSKGNPATKR